MIRQIPLADDGLIPNSRLPLLVYGQAVPQDNTGASTFENLFAGNGWGRCWRNGIYSFRHYHSTAHEVLGVAAGSARVEFGGPGGQALDVTAGDAVLIPAGVSHCNLGASADLLVVGAYPDDSATEDLCRDTQADRTQALVQLLRVRKPPRDPVVGDGGLLTIWR